MKVKEYVEVACPHCMLYHKVDKEYYEVNFPQYCAVTNLGYPPLDCKVFQED